MTTLAHKIPLELVSKILLMRPTHPTAKIIKDYAKWRIEDQTCYCNDEEDAEEVINAYSNGEDMTELLDKHGMLSWDDGMMGYGDQNYTPHHKELLGWYNNYIKRQDDTGEEEILWKGNPNPLK
jgi:hypothetical protein